MKHQVAHFVGIEPVWQLSVDLDKVWKGEEEERPCKSCKKCQQATPENVLQPCSQPSKLDIIDCSFAALHEVSCELNKKAVSARHICRACLYLVSSHPRGNAASGGWECLMQLPDIGNASRDSSCSAPDTSTAVASGNLTFPICMWATAVPSSMVCITCFTGVFAPYARQQHKEAAADRCTLGHD